MEFIEFDPETGRFRAEYNGDRDSVSLAIVAVVAAAHDRHPTDLAPLHSSIDTSALDDLFAPSSETDRRGSTAFHYEDYAVTVFSEGTIEARPAATP